MFKFKIAFIIDKQYTRFSSFFSKLPFISYFINLLYMSLFFSLFLELVVFSLNKRRKQQCLSLSPSFSNIFLLRFVFFSLSIRIVSNKFLKNIYMYVWHFATEYRLFVLFFANFNKKRKEKLTETN